MDTKKLRQKILDLAIRGRLVPQDPNDEPASVLLERIKAEKEQLIKEGKIKRSKRSAPSDTSPYENVPFEIPENWVWCKPADVFIINPRNNAEDTTEVGFVPMPLIMDGYHYQHSYESVPWKTVKTGYTHFANGDFGLAKITPCFENRKSVIFNNLPNRIGAGTTELHILRPIIIDVKYVSYFYSSEEFISYGIKNFSGAVGQQRISKEVIEDFGFALPPQQEQNRIIEAVEKWFSIIDQLEQEQTVLKDTIKRAKSKILDLAIRGKLVPQDPNDEPAIDLLRRINPNFKPCDNAHYKQLPKSWDIIHLGDICQLADGKVISITELPYLDVKSLRNQTYITKDSGKFIKAGTTLILVDGENSGEVFHATVDGYQSSTMKILNINSNINQLYVLNFIKLHQKALRENKVGSAIPHLNKKMFRELMIPIPPIAEQNRIVKEVDRYNVIMESIIAEL